MQSITKRASLTLLALVVAALLLACGPPPPAPELRGIDDWINSRPLTLQELRGQVVLIDFWTYTCVNCIRTFPHLREWHAKYSDSGLVVIGVHTPEFEFEKVRENVEEAVRSHGLEYPIAQDNNYATWNAYGNIAWPAKYLIDHNGNLRYYHLGEGAYAETEQNIRALLADTGVDVDHIEPNTALDPRFVEGAFAADPASRTTRELYAGYERNDTLPSSAFATLVGSTPAYIMHEEYYQQKDADIFYQDPGEHFNHFLYLQGLWRNGPQSISHARSTAQFEDYIAIKFYATSVNAVMSPCRGATCRAPAPDVPSTGGSTGSPRAETGSPRAETGSPPGEALVMVTLDGRPLTPAQAGQDVQFDSDGNSFVLVGEPRMYGLVELEEFSSHDLKLSAKSLDFSLFTFTFGAYAQGP